MYERAAINTQLINNRKANSHVYRTIYIDVARDCYGCIVFPFDVARHICWLTGNSDPISHQTQSDQLRISL